MSAERGIGRIDLRTRRFEKLITFERGASGIAWMAVDGPWLVWTLGNSITNLADWSLLVLNLETGEGLTLATSRQPNGSFTFGPQPLPALRGGRVAWSHPVPRRGQDPEAEIHVYDLAARRDAVIASGRASSPVYAGSFLIWGARGERDGIYSFQAVNARDLTPAGLPPRLRDPGSILYLAGSADHFAWTSGLSAMIVWRIGTDVYSEYASPDIDHYFQFLQLAGPYLLWYGGTTSSLLDLRTGLAFDVNGSLAGSPDMIARSEPVRPPTSKTDVPGSRVSAVRVADAPRLSACRSK